VKPKVALRDKKKKRKKKEENFIMYVKGKCILATDRGGP
jgi:hypothetical protein